MADFDPLDYDGGAGAIRDPLFAVDPTGGEEAFPGDEGLGLDEEKQLRDAVLILVDCSSREALAPLRPNGRSLVGEALAAAATLLKRKVVSSPEDRVGIALYGVREKLNPNNFEGIRVLQDLERPNAQRIRQLEGEISRSAASFEERYGHARPTPLSDVFWTCTTIFNLSANPKQFDPRIWLFTCTDSPCRTEGERGAAETRATDLKDLGVQIELFPLPPAERGFSMDIFWGAVVPVDTDDFIGKAAVTLENLERWIRMREHRKRTLQRLNFELCPGAEIGVSIFCTTIEARVPYPVYLLNENNKLLKSETKHICGSTGQILHPVDDVESFVELAGERVHMSRAEVNETKAFGEPGMTLLAMKSRSCLQPHHRIFHSYFVYPNERNVTGSSAVCQALIDRMLEKDLMAVVRYIPRRNAEPVLVVLLPQAELVDEDGCQVRNPGFHMIRMPWGEEIRRLEIPGPEMTGPTPVLQDAARRAVTSMRLDGFRPGCAENPVLQQHYAAVQALALGEDKPAETVDVLLPDATALEEKAPLFKAWREAADMAVPLVKGLPPKRPLPLAEGGEDEGGGAPRARARREAPAAPTTLEEMRELVRLGELDRLTVGVLKDWLKGQGVVATGKKADLVERVRAVV